MAIQQTAPTSDVDRFLRKIAELERRIADLERALARPIPP
jgi:hypothetical protein